MISDMTTQQRSPEENLVVEKGSEHEGKIFPT